MKIEKILKKLESYANQQGIRAYSELLHLHSISKVRGNCYEDELAAAGLELIKKAEETGTVTGKALEEFESTLAVFSDIAKEYTLHMVAHAHIDMNWMWGYHETVSATLETFRTILQMMKEYPEFTFSQSQASVYQIVEKYEPMMLDEIKHRVKENRWEVTASTWVEEDKNMASGEAQCQQIVYAKRYLSELLDMKEEQLRLAFEPDTFGHGLYEPEILQNGGVNWMYHCRGCDQRDLYRWRAPSGKEVLVHQEPKWYNDIISPTHLADYPIYCARVGKGTLRDALVVYGVGNHGGGPTRHDLELIYDMQRWPLFPEIQFSRYDTYFKIAEKYIEELPVYEGELNFIFDGCYTSQSRLKIANRLSEDRLYDAEVLTALAGTSEQTQGNRQMLDEGWKNTLFNQFHDILPGSCVLDSREYSMGKFQDILAAANTAANNALRSITGQIDTTDIIFDENRRTISEGAGVGYHMGNSELYPFSFTERGRGSVRIWHVFNTTQYARDEYVEVKVWDYPEDIHNIVIIDSKGNELQYDILLSDKRYMGHYISKLLVRVQVPAFGYNTCVLRQKEEIQASERLRVQYDGPRSDHKMGDKNYVLENEYIYCEFDAITCELISLCDQESGQELISNQTAGCFEYVEENPRFLMTAWRIGPAMKKINLNHTHPVHVNKYEQGKVISTLEYQIEFKNSKLDIAISLDGMQKYLDFSVTVDWMEKPEMEMIPALRFIVNPGYEASKFRYTTGSGSIIREGLPHDVPSLGTMEYLPEKELPVHLFLFSDCKYGFRGKNGDCGVNLIRSSNSPDMYPELNRHYMHLYIGVVQDEKDARRLTFCTAHKMPVVSGFSHNGTRSLSGKLFEYKGDCMVTSICRNEVGKVAVRLFNPEGKAQRVEIFDNCLTIPPYAYESGVFEEVDVVSKIEYNSKGIITF